MAVQLIIKSAAQNVEDFKIDCEMSWTISQVKDQITASYPTKPAKENQKLIYGGKLLPDHLPLTSILNPKQDIHILHLVCSFPQNSEAFKSKADKKTADSKLTVPQSNNGIYPQTNQQLPTLFNSTPQVVNTFALNSADDVFNQYLAMQQMYTQFMTQYLSQYNGNLPSPQVPVTPPAAQQSTPPQPQRNVNHNADAINIREGVDWIDLLYIFTRSLIFFVIILYYSDPPRVVAVVVLILMLFLFAKLKHQRQRAEVNQETDGLRNENDSLAANIQTASESNDEDTEDTSSETPAVSPAQSSRVQSTVSVPSLVFNFIIFFFTSLIPSDPLPVNAN